MHTTEIKQLVISAETETVTHKKNPWLDNGGHAESPRPENGTTRQLSMAKLN